jgi:hypothetical protein
MKTFRNLRNQPAAIPLLADDVLEFHAARLILLLRVCGTKTRSTGLHRIDGLTKLAKLDFFVRYPQFLAKVISPVTRPEPVRRVESSMIRYHYGPWDQRYYHVLAFLESRGLLTVSKEGNAIVLTLTTLGETNAAAIAAKSSFGELVDQMKCVKKALGNQTGSQLKSLVYETFKNEVAERSRGEVIK